MDQASAYGFGFDGGTAIALGTFDGVHTGHIRVLSKAAEFNKQFNTMALTFSAPPKKAKMLCSLSKKEQLILKTGVKQVFTLDFDFVKDLSPEEFFKDILIESFNAKVLVCGYNYRFGRGASGDVKKLGELCKASNISLYVCQEHTEQNLSVSSTKIRDLLSVGDCQTVYALLGRYFEIGEAVSCGRHDGSAFGFATANIIPSPSLIIPKEGVYATYTRIGEDIYPSVTNLGTQPTFESDVSVCETHIIGFDGDLYGRYIEVGFLKRLRDIIKFDNKNLLFEQINSDKEISELIFAEKREKI
ncbi:MAG: riboflavin biosynthesis protein RibF [Clostridia bacterium]|nr:riboflavin biosynthesis protein RibF [Clostridia bacterium]